MKVDLSKTDIDTILLALDKLRIKNTREELVEAKWVRDENMCMNFIAAHLEGRPNKVAKRAWSAYKFIKRQVESIKET